MTKPSKKPAAGQWDKKALLQNLLRRSRNIFTITLPTEGMGWTDIKKNFEEMKEILGLLREDLAPLGGKSKKPKKQ